MSINTFGGDWTDIKLNIFDEYLNTYCTALKNKPIPLKPFQKIYIDAFAGTGEYKSNDKVFEGSAIKALKNNHFSEYHFIEINDKKMKSLKNLINEKFQHQKNKVYFHKGDANDALVKLLGNIKWQNKRALMLLDPFALTVEWQTLEKISEIKYIDIWYLIPISAYSRLTAKNINKIHDTWKIKIQKTLNYENWDEIEIDFYKQSPQGDFFNSCPKDKVSSAGIEKTVYDKLKILFGDGVLGDMVRLRNSRNSHMFSFCFICTNNNPPARVLAKKLATDIVKKYSSE